MERLFLAVLVVASLLSAGCISDPSSPSLEGIPEGTAPTGAGAGSAADHAAAQKTEGGLTVDRSGDQWVARRTVTYANDFGGASEANVHLATDAGGVIARDWSQGGYRTTILLEARADSEQEARTWVDRITVTHSDRLSEGKLTLSTDVDNPSNRPDGVSLSGAVTANLPRQPSYTMELDAAAGGASTQGLNGRSVDADVAAGGVSVDGAFGRMTVNAAAGGVQLLGTANDVAARATAGGLSARLRAGGSGTWTFDVTAGGLEVDIERSAGDAFDVQASVTAGGLAVRLSDGETLSEGGGFAGGSKHVRSRGFDAAAIQVTVDADVTAGGATVND